MFFIYLSFALFLIHFFNKGESSAFCFIEIDFNWKKGRT